MVVIINGLPQSGKSTFVELCKIFGKRSQIIGENKFRVFEYSTVDFVKDVAKNCGWNGEKTLKNRKFLSDLKQLLTDWDDVPFKETIDFIKTVQQSCALSYPIQPKPNLPIIFIHCREPEQIQRFKEYKDIGLVKTLFIERKQCDNDVQSNSSDANVKQYQYDEVITNDGTLGDLSLQAEDFLIKCVKLEKEYAESNYNNTSI